MAKQHLIAVVGLCISGKSEVVKYWIDKHQFPRVYFPACLFRELDRRGLAHIQEHERPLREAMRAEHGMAVMAKLSLPEIREGFTKSDIVIIESMYSFSEYELVRKEYRENFHCVAVHADRALRYERGAKRALRPLTPKEIDERDDSEVRNIEKAQPIALADFHLLNNGTLMELMARADAILKQIQNS